MSVLLQGRGRHGEPTLHDFCNACMYEYLSNQERQIHATKLIVNYHRDVKSTSYYIVDMSLPYYNLVIYGNTVNYNVVTNM